MAKHFKKAGPLGRHYLKEWREGCHLTLRRLAELLQDPAVGNGLDFSTLSKIEKFEQPYSQHLIEACAEVFGCLPHDIIGRDPSDEERVLSAWDQVPGDRETALAAWDEVPDEQKPQVLEIIKTFRKT